MKFLIFDFKGHSTYICIGKDLERPEPHMRNHTSGKDFRFDKTKFMERYVFGGLKNVGLQCLIFH